MTSTTKLQEKQNRLGEKGVTRIRSKRVAWSTLTKSASQALSSSSTEEPRSSGFGASTCFLQYSMTFDKILLVTLGKGIPLSAQSSSIMCLIVCDSKATASSTSNVSPSELFSVIFRPEDIFRDLWLSREKREMGVIRFVSERKRKERKERERKSKENQPTDGDWKALIALFIHIFIN